MSSVKYRKEIASTTKNNEPISQKILNQPFSQEQLLELWNDLAEQLYQKGEKILSSSLKIGQPKLTDQYIINVLVPNQSLKNDIENMSDRICNLITKKFHNNTSRIKITVDDKEEKKYYFLPEEKYEKLKEINPNIKLLRELFNTSIL